MSHFKKHQPNKSHEFDDKLFITVFITDHSGIPTKKRPTFQGSEMEGQTSSGLGWLADPMRGFNDLLLKLHGFLHVYKVRIQR